MHSGRMSQCYINIICITRNTFMAKKPREAVMALWFPPFRSGHLKSSESMGCHKFVAILIFYSCSSSASLLAEVSQEGAEDSGLARYGKLSA